MNVCSSPITRSQRGADGGCGRGSWAVAATEAEGWDGHTAFTRATMAASLMPHVRSCLHRACWCNAAAEAAAPSVLLPRLDRLGGTRKQRAPGATSGCVGVAAIAHRRHGAKGGAAAEAAKSRGRAAVMARSWEITLNASARTAMHTGEPLRASVAAWRWLAGSVNVAGGSASRSRE